MATQGMVTSAAMRTEDLDRAPARSAETAASPSSVSLSLLGRFSLRHGAGEIAIPFGSQRVLAYVALAGRRIERVQVAGTLWPCVPEDRGQANLRSALWRLNAERDLVVSENGCLGLDPDVTLDLADGVFLARRLCNGKGSDPSDFGPSLAMLSADLLPGWYDDWVLIEAEAWRQLRLHALERLAEELARIGRFAEALTAGLTAVSAEPLRESAHAAVIQVHLAEGNCVEALRQYRLYEYLLGDELGLAPTDRLRSLIGDRLKS